jgi:glutamate N-acetyltransferase/amino-acid N-acetyltransferase
MLDGDKERVLIKMLKEAELPSDTEDLGYPTHSREVEIKIDLGCGDASTCVRGSDLTHGYVSCNAEYRS